MELMLAVLLAFSAHASDRALEWRVEQRLERSLTPEFLDVVVRRITARDGHVAVHTVLRPEVDRARRVSFGICWVLDGVPRVRVLSYRDRELRRC